MTPEEHTPPLGANAGAANLPGIRYTQTRMPDPTPPIAMDIVKIMSILPHRYPLLLIDRVLAQHRRSANDRPSITRTSPGASA